MSEINNVFAEITRKKVRFETPKGFLTIEDVWDLPLTSVRGLNLDDLAKSVNKKLKEATEESFVKTKSKKANILELQMKAILYIIDVKLKERDKAKKRKQLKEEKELLLTLMKEKEIEELKNKNLDEIKKRIEEIDNEFED